MLMLEFDSERYNYICLDGEPYFVFKLPGGRMAVLPDRCPHRGGPLHLGTSDCKKYTLTCPWHETVFLQRALMRKAIPAVTLGRRITALFPVAATAKAVLTWRRIIANGG